MRIEQSPLLQRYLWLIHGFCSPGRDHAHPHEDNFSFNCGSPAQVLSARHRACGTLDLQAEQLTFVYQEHGTRILCVTVEDCGAGSLPERERLGPADGLYTSIPHVPLGILVADCLPVFVADTRRRRVGLVHSGWRGTYGNIVGRLLAQWRGEGALMEDIAVWIGPGIGLCCFEVGSEVLEAFTQRYPEWEHYGKWDRPRPAKDHPPVSGAGRIDLKSIVLQQLLREGIPSERIDISPACTMCGDGYFSYRRDGAGFGHNMAVMALRGNGCGTMSD